MVRNLAICLMVVYDGCFAVNHVKLLSERRIVLEVQWPTLKLVGSFSCDERSTSRMVRSFALLVGFCSVGD